MRRTNVAVTRAKKHLALIGDSSTVSKEMFIKGMIDYCHEYTEVHSAYDYINGMSLLLMKLDSMCTN